MRVAIQMCVQIALAGLALAVAGADENPTSVVQLARQEARWAGPGGGDIFTDTSGSWFVISGDVRNAGRKPLAYVKLLFELVDGDGTALASEHGYNHRAEDLRLPDYEAGKIRRADLPEALGRLGHLKSLSITASEASALPDSIGTSTG